MCGIIGYIGDRDGLEILKYGLKAVEYRGYDSVGYYDGRLVKDVGKVDDFLKKVKDVKVPFIAHTRWATHGKVSAENAHPHKVGKIALVHNGTIENYKALKEKLPYEWKSETDTEVIAALLDYYNEEDFLKTLEKVLPMLKGTYALAIIREGDPRIYFAKKDTPLLLGIGEGENFVASDLVAFLPYTNRYIRLEDGEYGYIERDKYVIKGRENIRPQTFEGDIKAAFKGEFPTFMLKEIHEQLDIVPQVLSVDVSEVREIFQTQEIDIIAAGTSYHAAWYLRYLTGFNVHPYVASEYPYLMREPKWVFAISQSGETIDTIKAVKQAKQKGAKVISLTNYVSSTLAALSDYVVPLNAGIEIGVAATKTFLAQLLFAHNLIGDKDIKGMKEAVRRGLEAPLFELTKPKIFFLGRGINYVLAMEGALKFKELTYVPAEAFPAGEMKHGPLSLFDKDTDVVFFLGPQGRELAKVNMEEVRARGANVHEVIFPDKYYELSATVFLQRLAHEHAVRWGKDPDKPRHLAKSVTVE
ncbi:MAG: glutamine--fructose-6-phosphate transaminase (isomerizing) [Candidatus Micrarchaeota archaeon]|nr:glutamine--fructose-6-phosphate transaminase (isomerizing) [Candidatus Micrarchaeota archaeon]